jgi:DNA-binding NarL/FixJ family response regulator/class 3 adenylate cyclase
MPARALPEGTVTLLFSDIERSTPMVAELGDAYPEVLERHRGLIRETVRASGGAEIDCLGDEAFAAFSNARQAVDAAAEIQQVLAGDERLAAIPLRVRIGVHTGQPMLSNRNYVGLDVHRAARICSAGHGGQVLLSEPTKAALGDGHALELRDLGAQWLRGLPRPERLYQLVAPGLQTDFPPLRHVEPGIDPGAQRLRVVVADDSLLLREGVVRVLGESGFEVVGQAGSGPELLAEIERAGPDVAIVDIRMPPTQTDEGIRAALEIRRSNPGVGVVVLSQFAEPAYALDLLESGARGIGYLLKDRVSDVLDFGAAVRRVGDGGTALDPEVVSLLVGRARLSGPLANLSDSEAELAQLVAEGRSAREIADRLVVDEDEAEERLENLLTGLGLEEVAPEERNQTLLATLLQAPRTA